MKRGLILLVAALALAADASAQTTPAPTPATPAAPVAAPAPTGRTVSGTVLSADDGDPLTGAIVRIKGGTGGTATDVDGNFTLVVPDGEKLLAVAYSGFIAQQVSLDTVTGPLIVHLQYDQKKSISEVVVVGYGTVRRRDLTGSVSSVTAREIADMPLNSASDVLTGRLAGVNIVSSEGQPGSDATVRVRGGGSITQDNSPIYIVDGIQIENALQILSPQEIESVDVLKDAASTAIYGARGANGVILITTKSGRNKKTAINFDAFYGVRQIANKLDVMNPADFVRYQYQVYNLSGDTARGRAFTQRYGRYEDLDIYATMPTVDWQDAVFGRDARQFTQNLNVTGGDARNTFSFNLTNTNEQGVMLNSGFRRMMGSFKYDHVVSDRLKLGVNARYSDQRVQGAGTSATGTQGNNRLRNAVRFQPFVSPGQDVDVFDPNYAELTNLTIPTLLAEQEVRYDHRRDILLNGYANLNILKNLTLRSTLGVAPSFTRLNQFSGVVTGVARQNADMPVVVTARGEGLTINNSNTLSYNLKGRHFNLDALVGQETYQTRANSLSITTKWLPVDITPAEAFSGIQRATPPTGQVQDAPVSLDQAPNKLMSYFTRINASFYDKYLVTATLRRDGSNRFSEENRWGTFPSVALAWRLSSESFWRDYIDKKHLTDVKVRLSLGSVGNNRIAGDLYQTVFGVSTSSYAFFESVTPGIGALSLANPNIKWETTISRNLGFDIGLANGRVNLIADFYLNNTRDLLLQAAVPGTTGYTTQIQNLGRTQNRGMEFQLATSPVRNRTFTWNSNFNISFNRNKVVDLGTNPDGSLVDFVYGYSGWITPGTPDFIVQRGQPLGQFYGYVNDGYYTLDDFNYNPETGVYTLKENVVNNRTALGNRDPQPGDMKFQKLSPDSSLLITNKDMTVIGNALPKFTGGWNNQFSYRNFDLSVFVYFSYGNQVYNANRIEYTTQYLYSDNNMLSLLNDRWQWYDDNGVRVTDPEQLAAMNQDTKFWTPAGGQYVPQSFAIEDGSFLRLSNITLGYTIPTSLLKRTRILSRLRFYATVNNLYTFTRYTGFDPEANTRRATPLTPGVDYSAYPRSRFVLGGLNLTF